MKKGFLRETLPRDGPYTKRCEVRLFGNPHDTSFITHPDDKQSTVTIGKGDDGFQPLRGFGGEGLLEFRTYPLPFGYYRQQVVHEVDSSLQVINMNLHSQESNLEIGDHRWMGSQFVSISLPPIPPLHRHDHRQYRHFTANVHNYTAKVLRRFQIWRYS